jgi:hypothetical protein
MQGNAMQTRAQRSKALAAGILVSGLMTLGGIGSVQAAVVYSLDMSISGTAFNGLITINDSSANYLAGGPTNQFDVLGFTFSWAGVSFSNVGSGIQTMNLSYSPTMDAIVTWDISAFTIDDPYLFSGVII